MKPNAIYLLASVLVLLLGTITYYALSPDPGPAAELRPSERLRGPEDQVQADAPSALRTETPEERQRQTTEAEMGRLHDLRAAEKAGLLATAELAEALKVETEPSYLIPLALRSPSVALDPTEAQVVERVRQSFLETMRQAGDPSTKEYLERWLAEEERVDQLLTAYLGPEAIGKFALPPPVKPAPAQALRGEER